RRIFDLRSVRIVMLKTFRPDTISTAFGGVRNMVSGSGRTAFALLIIFASVGCSTEDTGLVPVDAAEDPTNSAQGFDPDGGRLDARVKVDKPPTPDLAPPDLASLPDAPEPADVSPPDLAPDKPPLTNQPQGADCSKNSECRGGHCVDGVCCDSACDDGCSACSQKRTGRSDGTCARARDMEGKACGKACSSVATMPAVVEKVCAAGACVVPSAPKVLTSCQDSNPCVVAFCDNNEARCVKTTCPQQGTCCCRSSSGQRACTSRTQCTGSKTCE